MRTIYLSIQLFFFFLVCTRSGGLVFPWIKLVDEYQVLCAVLGLDARANQGNWSRVAPMMAPGVVERQASASASVAARPTAAAAAAAMLFVSRMRLDSLI